MQHNGKPAAKLLLNVHPMCLKFIPANVDAAIKATTVFGNNYVILTAPKTRGCNASRPTM